MLPELTYIDDNGSKQTTTDFCVHQLGVIISVDKDTELVLPVHRVHSITAPKGLFSGGQL